MSAKERMFLKAIVALWLKSPAQWVDGPNDPREFCPMDYSEAYELVERLLEGGYIEAGQGGTLVVPTALGVFEALA